MGVRRTAVGSNTQMYVTPDRTQNAHAQNCHNRLHCSATVEIRKLGSFRLYTDQNRRAHEARQHDGKTWTHTENLRVFETAIGRHLQFLTVSKTAFDKLMPLKWSLLLCVCVCVCVSHHVRLLLLRVVNVSTAMLYDVT